MTRFSVTRALDLAPFKATSSSPATSSLTTNSLTATDPAAKPRFAPVSRLAMALTMVATLAACEPAEERAQGHYESGLELVEEGDPVKAKLEFRNALKLDDTHAKAHLELGKLFQGESNFGAAVGHYIAALDLDETLLEAHLRVGQLMLAANRIDDALEKSVTTYQLAPEDIEVLVLKASVEIKLENLDAAEDTVEDAARVDPNSPEVWILRTALMRRQGEDEQALAIIDEGLKRNPDHVALSLLRIDVLAALNRLDDLGDTLQGLAETYPDRLPLREALVRWNLSNSDFVSAEQNLRDLAAADLDNPERSIDIVRLVEQLRGSEEALAELDRLIEEADQADRPDRLMPFMVLKARYLAGNDRREDAEGVLQDAIDKLGFTGEGYAARLTLARFLMERGEMDGARELVETVVTRDPTNGEAYTLRGRLLIIDQDYDTAVTELRRAIKESPDNVEALITLSTALNFNGNRSLAGERLGDAVEASDFAPRPSLLYADYLAQEGRLDLAGNLLADSHQRNPNARQVLVALARIKLAEGDYVAAEEAGEKLRALDDGDGRAANQIVAAALTGQERFDETLALLGTEATELENVTRSQIAGLITAYVRSGRNDEARTFLATALEQYPGNPELLRLRGRLDEVEGNIEDAEASYLAALETNSGYVPVYDALSKLMIRQGRDADAEELLVNGIENSAGNTDALRFSLAALLERRGAFSDAVYQYRLLLQRQPTSDVIANNLASIIADNDPSEEDIETAYNVAKRLRTSEIPHFQDTYGWLMHLRGDHAGALGALERAVEQLPDNPIVQYHYGAVLAALEQYERAREALDKAVELGGESALPQIERARALLAELPAESAVQ